MYVEPTSYLHAAVATLYARLHPACMHATCLLAIHLPACLHICNHLSLQYIQCEWHTSCLKHCCASCLLMSCWLGYPFLRFPNTKSNVRPTKILNHMSWFAGLHWSLGWCVMQLSPTQTDGPTVVLAKTIDNWAFYRISNCVRLISAELCRHWPLEANRSDVGCHVSSIIKRVNLDVTAHVLQGS